MFGLIDCNNFFVSCERVFNPSLTNRPVIVLSNNDGCIIALSNEAKAIGLRRGNPFFQVRHIIESNNVAVFSGNHRLYGDMSSRVMSTLSSIVPDIDIYSVDEAFIDFNSIECTDIMSFGHRIVTTVRRHTGIPVSLGIAPTKTLAKVAAHFAKKYTGYKSVCIIDSDNKRRKALSMLPVKNVWGIGRRLDKKLAWENIDTALDFANTPIERIKRILNVNGERTWLELNGQACIEHEVNEPDNKQICSSRSFGTMLTDYHQLEEAIAAFVTITSRKLRSSHNCASSISVFIMTNHHRDDMPQYNASATRTLEEPASDTMTLCNAAFDALKSIFRKGYHYKRAGVIINEIVNGEYIQHSMFRSESERRKRSAVMKVIDQLNCTDSMRDKVHIAVHTPTTSFVRQELRSPLYSTRMSDIITVHSKQDDKK